MYIAAAIIIQLLVIYKSNKPQEFMLQYFTTLKECDHILETMINWKLFPVHFG